MILDSSPNYESCELVTLLSKIKKYKLIGDVVEFGTFSCESAIFLANGLRDRTIFTIDHFKGLEKSNKILPQKTDWSEGMFSLSHPLFANEPRVPKSVEEAKQKISPYDNIKLIVSDIHELTEPKNYGIGKISLVNIDVDIYEPTVSALEFVTKCEWNELYIRFDDWHGGKKSFDQHERLAFSEWIDKYQYSYIITHGGPCGGVYLKR